MTPISSCRQSSDDTDIDAAAARLLSDLPAIGFTRHTDAPDDLAKIRTIRHYLYLRRGGPPGADESF